ncbi:IPT/TIG domain-containing protein [Microbacterium sp. ZW T5_56]|uniref:IPT/TIG domain-containing protein n=1 Tax=Microbacterium sp. ZW T5_56 TaxID=3378081 RepID=UPI003854DED1
MATAALAVASVFGIGLIAPPAVADTGDRAVSSSQFLSGSLLSAIDITSIAGLGGAVAENNGVATVDTDAVGLDVSLLSAIRLGIADGLELPFGDIFEVGAVNQYAEASNRGVSRAASGAVSNNGAVDIGGNTGGFPSNASIKLGGLLTAVSGPLTGTVTDVRVDLQALTGVAALDAGAPGAIATNCGPDKLTALSAPVHCRDYSIAGGKLLVSAPVLGNVVNTLTGPGGVVATVDGAVNSLAGPDGLLAGVIAGLDAALAPLLGNDALTVAISTNVAGAVNSIIDTPLTDPTTGVEVNLRTGVITADLNTLLTQANGAGLANLAPNTEILSAPVLNALVASVTSLLNQIPQLVSTALTSALNAATLNIGANICLVGSGANCSTGFPDLGTGINIAVTGTLGGLAATPPAATNASLTLKVLGLPVTIPISTLLSALAGPIVNTLFNPTTGVIATVTGSTSALTGAVQGLVTALDPALKAINLLASITGNVQESPSTGVYREVAVRVALLRSAVATLDLASATVGANVFALPVPVATSISPNTGPTAGGTPVTITGSNLDGATEVLFGGVPATITSNTPTTVNVTTPPHAAGSVPVIVTTPGGTSASLIFTYIAPPTLTGLTPNVGPVGGGTSVVITGTGFTGASAVTFGGTAAVAFTVSSNTQITATSPAHVAGPADVTVTTAGGVSAPQVFTYFDQPVIGGGGAIGLDPDHGSTAGGTGVTITGAGFLGADEVTFDGESLPFTVVDDTTITTTTIAHAAGAVDVVVSNPVFESDPATFTFVPLPAITGLAPSFGPIAGGTSVTITGSGFADASIVTFGGIDLPVGAHTDTSIVVTSPAHAAGPVDVTVTNSTGTSAPQTFTYYGTPVIGDGIGDIGLNPAQGPTSGGTLVTITGSGFTGVDSVTFDGDAVTFTVISDTEIEATTTAHPAGAVDVVVSNPLESSDPATFTFYDAPVIGDGGPGTSGLNPSQGPTAGGTSVTVTGENFVPGDTSVTIGGTVVSANDVTVASETELEFITPPHVAGGVPVTVTTPGGTSNAQTFSYYDTPVIGDGLGDIGLDPDYGSIAGGTTVIITGTGLANVTSVTFGDQPARSFIVNSDTQITAVTEAHAAGSVQVSVANPLTTSNEVPYRYLPVPAPTSLSPTFGPTTGGTAVTITGTGFAGATSVDFGGTVLPLTNQTSDTTILVSSPPHAAGGVNVTVTNVSGTSAPLQFTYYGQPVIGDPDSNITGLDPDKGPVAGGTAVTITGTGFTGANAVTFGGAPARSFTVISDTQIDAVTEAHPAGAVDVVVSNPALSSDPATFTYYDVPVIGDGGPGTDGLDPSVGPSAGGTPVTVTGENFVAGDTSVTIGGTVIAPADVTVASETELSFTTPAHAAGAVDVTVTTPGGTSNAQTFTYYDQPVIGDPDTGITGLDPDAGPVAGGTAVTITGSGLADVDTVMFGDLPARSFTVVSDTQIDAVTEAHAAGAVDVVVSNPALSSDPETYTYYDEPVIGDGGPGTDGLNPSFGPSAGGTPVTVTGENFVPGKSSVTIGGTVIAPANVTVASETELSFTTPAHAAGAVDVTVTTPGGTSNAQTFTYFDKPVIGDPETGISGLDPDAGPTAGGTAVHITGTGFLGATSVTFGGSPAASFTVESDTSIQAVTAPHAAGPVDVVVSNPSFGSDPATFTYYDVPVIGDGGPGTDGLDPSVGPSTGGTPVTVTGENFVPGKSSVTIGGTVIAPANVTVASETELSFTTPAHAAGAVDVTVTTPGGTSNAQTFTYFDKPVIGDPEIGDLGLDPTAGPTAGGTAVTITGSGLADVDTVMFGDLPARSFTVVSDTRIDAVTEAHAAGPVDVVVSNPAVASDPAVYTYTDAPVIGDGGPGTDGLNPSFGPVAGGTPVTVTGENFVAGKSSVTIGGTVIPAANVTVDSATELLFTTPAHAAGPVDVTITTPGGTSNAQTFTYYATPVIGDPETGISGLDPEVGPVAGGTVVQITGTGFTGVTSVTFGGDAAASFTVESDTLIEAVTAPHAAGPVDVVVANPSSASDPATFTFYDVPVIGGGGPGTDGLNPSFGPVTGGTSVTVTGENFVDGDTSVTIGGTVIAPTDVTVISDTELSFTTPAHTAGGVDVTVTTPGGTSNAQTFTYYDQPVIGDPESNITGLDPDKGPVAGGTGVTITGTGFTGVNAVTFGGAPARSFTVVSDTQIDAVTEAHPAGAVDVVVSNPALSSDPATFTYYDVPVIGDGGPGTDGLNPSFGPVAGGTSVTVTGENFVDGESSVTIGGTVIAPAEVTVASETELSFTTPAHAAGPVDVTVTTPGGTSNAQTFTYYDQPVIGDPEIGDLGLDPDRGPIEGGTTVTITGSGFTGANTVTFGDAPAASFTVVDDGTITAVTAAHAAGAVDVVVSNPVAASDPATFTYEAGTVQGPEIDQLNPDEGYVTGGEEVIITGRGFTGATSVAFGEKDDNGNHNGEENGNGRLTRHVVKALAANESEFEVISDTEIRAITPPHAEGPVDVVVTTPVGTSGPAIYTYIPLADTAPSVDSLTPDSGPTSGGTEVTIVGGGFTPDTTVTVDGTDVPAEFVDDSTLTITTPAHAEGVAEVIVMNENGSSAPVDFTYVGATPTPTPTETSTPTPTPTETSTPTPTPTETSTPTPTPTETSTPTPTGTSTPTPTATSTTTAGPTTPVNPSATSTRGPGGNLPGTGSDLPIGPLAVGILVLLLGVVVAARRTRRTE